VPADRANDGNTNGDLFDDYSVFRNLTDPVPSNLWWEVDLGSESLLSDIAVWNRTDSRWDYLVGAVVQLLDDSRNVVGTSNPLSSNTTQNPVFTGTTSSSLFIGTSPTNSLQGTNLLTGGVALPFMSEGVYTVAQVQDIYDRTQGWFAPNALLTIQGTSNDVKDIVFGDDDDYFIVTSDGITHFDQYGIVIRTMNTDANSATNTQIVSNYINDIDYKNRYLTIAYDDPDDGGAQQARGLEIITIGIEPND